MDIWRQSTQKSNKSNHVENMTEDSNMRMLSIWPISYEIWKHGDITVDTGNLNERLQIWYMSTDGCIQCYRKWGLSQKNDN